MSTASLRRAPAVDGGHRSKSRSQSSSALRRAGPEVVLKQQKGIKKTHSEPNLHSKEAHKSQQQQPNKLERAPVQDVAVQQSADASRSQRRSMVKDARRKILEVLSNPDVANIAKKLFNAQVHNPNGRLDYNDLRQVLKDTERQLGITFPTKAEKLFKRFDINGDGNLSCEEFLELFVSSLRRCAFDRSTLVGRDIFVSKQRGQVWDLFKQDKKIGTGTFGSAFLCKNKKTDEERVVKAVKKMRAQLPVEEIEKEILVMLQIDHPHIVRLFNWYEDHQYIYLVLDALKGGTLNDVIMYFQQRQKPLKEEWARTVTQQVMQAMAYCHSLRLIHKDLKDENIMLLKKDPNYDEPFAVVIDLGVAEMFSSSDPSGKIVGGTPVTMAPEVWKGEFGPKCDVWSLGCILYEMLAGRFPFEAPSINPKDWLALHKRGADFSALRSSNSGIAMCQVMLTYRDTDRPSMSDCLQHKWFEASRKSLRKLSPDLLGPLQAFAEASATKRAVLLQVASRFPMAHANRVIDVFKSFDVNNDASLSLEELKTAFRGCGVKDEALLAKVFQAMDVDGDNSLSFTEFTAGCLLAFVDLLDDRFYKLFKENDSDNDGYMTISEAEEFLHEALELVHRNSRADPSEMVKDMFHGGRKKISYKDMRDKILGPLKV
eukprot:TRINITY_DN40569_c0_g2_i1.p1 TRINITY_DN40569_c0_g2~~TRINITY_DN40569_c0_g2_i1.p1  ORF type:complete len:674 (-),score=145.05 TRINITY_DN40569_c0_g2_i1:45-2015(-)